VSRVLALLVVAACAGQPEHVADPAGVWRPLLDGKSLQGWQVTNFGGEGEVAVEHGALRLGLGNPLTGITWLDAGALPTTDYELRLTATRVDGNDFFAGVTFPVGDSHCSLILGGWGGSVVGLSSLDGMDASENETTRMIRFEQDRPYRVRIRVTADRIGAWLDEQCVVDATITGRLVSLRPEVLLSRPLGIASFATVATIRDLAIRRLGR
jgi:hypothetical protein